VVVVALNMTVPMAAWMRYGGHGLRPTAYQCPEVGPLCQQCVHRHADREVPVRDLVAGGELLDDVERLDPDVGEPAAQYGQPEYGRVGEAVEAELAGRRCGGRCEPLSTAKATRLRQPEVPGRHRVPVAQQPRPVDAD
jgi:hypothetical protein